jgi:hypothetical protein
VTARATPLRKMVDRIREQLDQLPADALDQLSSTLEEVLAREAIRPAELRRLESISRRSNARRRPRSR